MPARGAFRGIEARIGPARPAQGGVGGFSALWRGRRRRLEPAGVAGRA